MVSINGVPSNISFEKSSIQEFSMLKKELAKSGSFDLNIDSQEKIQEQNTRSHNVSIESIKRQEEVFQKKKILISNILSKSKEKRNKGVQDQFMDQFINAYETSLELNLDQK